MTIFLPRIITEAVKTAPTIPTTIPKKIVTPSRLNSPNDIITMPKAGIKLVKGKGIAIDTAKIKEKKPIICVPLLELKIKILEIGRAHV